MKTVHINSIEAAIAFWLNRAPGDDGISISKPVSILADCYGLMIYHKKTEISMNDLTAKQHEVFTEAAAALGIEH